MKENQEEWKEIPGHIKFNASNKGRIKLLLNKNNNEEVVKFSRSKGYLYVKLIKNHKFFAVHRLIATVFIRSPLIREQVNHINGIKTDNRVENLEWCTQAENIRHAFAYGLNKGRIKEVQQFTRDGKFIKTYESLVSASKETGIGSRRIGDVCNKRVKTAGGFTWKYT